MRGSAPRPASAQGLGPLLEKLRRRYHKREFVSPDPLEVLYDYKDDADREVAGLVASSLAYGRVAQILRSVRKVLGVMGDPARYVRERPPAGVRRDLAGFRHRFTTGAEMAALLAGARKVIRAHGSLGECFSDCFELEGPCERGTVIPALTRFVERLVEGPGAGPGHLLPSPSRGSACKRLNLYLRWMVRSDEVDPGCWDGVPPSALVVPLDTHMRSICRGMELTTRRTADLGAALEATAAFSELAPNDPLRYDFALTRLGIRAELDVGAFLGEFNAVCAGGPARRG